MLIIFILNLALPHGLGQYCPNLHAEVREQLATGAEDTN
jgi:hypothetical protein